MTHPWLHFLDLLEDTDQTRMSWSKIGVAASTLFTVITGFFTMAQTAFEAAGSTNWGLLAGALSFHGIAKAANEFKRRTERQL